METGVGPRVFNLLNTVKTCGNDLEKKNKALVELFAELVGASEHLLSAPIIAHCCHRKLAEFCGNPRASLELERQLVRLRAKLYCKNSAPLELALILVMRYSLPNDLVNRVLLAFSYEYGKLG